MSGVRKRFVFKTLAIKPENFVCYKSKAELRAAAAASGGEGALLQALRKARSKHCVNAKLKKACVRAVDLMDKKVGRCFALDSVVAHTMFLADPGAKDAIEWLWNGYDSFRLAYGGSEDEDVRVGWYRRRVQQWMEILGVDKPVSGAAAAARASAGGLRPSFVESPMPALAAD